MLYFPVIYNYPKTVKYINKYLYKSIKYLYIYIYIYIYVYIYVNKNM